MASIKSLAIKMPKNHIKNEDSPYCDIPNIPKNWWRFWGIKARYIIDREGGETAEELAEMACRKALEKANISADEIDLILCNSTCFAGWGRNRNKALPRFANELKKLLGCPNALCLDIEQECITFLISLQIASNYIATGNYKKVLVCSSEFISGVLDFSDLSSTTFGDGAAAAIITNDANNGKLLSSSYGSNADFYSLATVQWRYPANKVNPSASDYWSYFTLDTNAPAEMQKFIPTAVPEMVNNALKKIGLQTSDINFYIFHQPSKILVSLWANNLGIDEDKYLLTLEDYGCMVSVSMPVTLYEAYSRKLIKPGDKIVIAGAATGWGFGAQIWEIGNINL